MKLITTTLFASTLLFSAWFTTGCSTSPDPGDAPAVVCEEQNTLEQDRAAALSHQSPATAPPELKPMVRGSKPDIPVLMYHDVLPMKQVWFDETLSDFRAQIKLIHDRGFKVIRAKELWKHLVDGSLVPVRSLVLTFDDATEGQYLYALPVLKQYHFPATFFIHTGYIGVTTSKRHLTWDELKAAEETGLIDVEARTVTHPCNMPDLTSQELAKELSGGVAAVQQHLGHGSPYFSYPCGHWNDKAADAVRSAGYVLAFDEERGFANRSPSILAVNRFTPRRLAEALNVR